MGRAMRGGVSCLRYQGSADKHSEGSLCIRTEGCPLFLYVSLELVSRGGKDAGTVRQCSTTGASHLSAGVLEYSSKLVDTLMLISFTILYDMCCHPCVLPTPTLLVSLVEPPHLLQVRQNFILSGLPISRQLF